MPEAIPKLIHPRVLAWQPVTDRGNLRGLARVQIGAVEFLDVRLIQQPDQRPFVSPPQASWQDARGKWCFRPLVRWPGEWDQLILDAILEADHAQGIQQQPATEFGCEVQRRAGVRGPRQ